MAFEADKLDVPTEDRNCRMKSFCQAGALRTMLLATLVAMVGCASLPARDPPHESHAFAEVSDTRLGRMVQLHAASAAGSEVSGFRLLPEAAFAFDARIALARRAEKSLDVQYYLLDNDLVGQQLLRELRDAALRGVRVRILLDDLYIGDDKLLVALAGHPNVDVRLFNPLPARGGGLLSRLARSLHEFGRINHRMHNKLFIADNSVSVSGGRNIGAEYFMRSGAANFIDIDVLAVGPIVRTQSQGFDSYWNSEQVYPIDQVVRNRLPPAQARRLFEEIVGTGNKLPFVRQADVLGRTSVAHQLEEGRLDLIWASARVLTDDPVKITRKTTEARFAGSVTERTLEAFQSARSKVVIISPYFIPGDIGLSIMKKATENGVVTIVLTNALGATDEPLVYAGYARYRKAMLKLGVVIYEVAPTLSRNSGQFGDFGTSEGRLHAKMAMIDERWMFIGSMNLDGRSASLNTETGLLIDSPELVADFLRMLGPNRFASAYLLRLDAAGNVEWVEQDGKGGQTSRTDEPDAGWLDALRNWLLLPFVREEFL